MGINIPNMGTKINPRVSKTQKRTSLADALFSTIQQRVLAYLFGQPERSFFATELIRLAGGGSGAVQRELARLGGRGALAPLGKRIPAAFVFGSVPKRSDTAASDIDVLVLSDSIDYADVFAALQSAEAKPGRTVNPTGYTPANWRKKRKEGNAFVEKVAAQPKVFLIVTG